MTPPVAIEMRLYGAIYVHQSIVAAVVKYDKNSEQYKEAIRKLKVALAEQKA